MLSNNKSQFDFLRFHHVGLLVKDIVHSSNHYINLFGEASVSKAIWVESQKVNVCFVQVGPTAYIELIQPDQESKVHALLKKNLSYYHVAYVTPNIKIAVTKLEQMDYRALDFFSSEAFDGRLCIFLFTPEGHLIELIETNMEGER